MIPRIAMFIVITGGLVSFCLAAAARPATTGPTSGPEAMDAPPEFAAIDRPNDAGQAILLSWRKMPYEGPDVAYEIWMGAPGDPQLHRQIEQRADFFRLKSNFPSAFGLSNENGRYHAHEVSKYLHPDPKNPAKTINTAVVEGAKYRFKLVVVRGGTPAAETAEAEAAAVSNWFAWDQLNVLVAMVLVSGVILYFVRRAKRRPDSIFVRRIPGLESVDEAIGRAAEMGKPIYFCHGLGSIEGGGAMMATVSSVNLLGKIAERVAEYGADMKVTCFDYLVQQVSQETVKEASIRVGRPDAYREDNIFYVADQAFAYATAVEGMLLREKPATCFFFGQFMSEALLLSETGAITKAIQIAGTDNWTQIPFFITTCDYTLIGEELYAASAYLSREPKLLGTVKGQDVVKAVIIVAIVVGAALAVCGVDVLARLFKVLN